MAWADPSGDEHQMILGQRGENLLRQHAGRDRADVAARLGPFDHQRICA